MAFKLKPWATETENKVRYLEAGRMSSFLDSTTARVVDHFSSPVHEELTHRMFGCDLPVDSGCADPLPKGRYAPYPVVFGVQWNDNPPFQVDGVKGCPSGTTIRLPNYSDCWITLFRDAEKNAPEYVFDGTTGHALIYRVHFGDMQFLHSMASWDGESTRDTKSRIMAWAELTYRTAIGDLSPGSVLANSDIEEIRNVFATKGWTIEGLFSLGQDSAMKAAVPDIAFGSLLHVVQDSFAKGHVERDDATAGTCNGGAQRKAGDIKEFHSYENQDKDLHGRADRHESMQAHLLASNPTAVQIGKTLVSMRASKVAWKDVQPYLAECVFPVPAERLRHPAGPGQNFRG
jgi:hypothetical protein